MAELDDVRIGETIAVEWGNAIRDRTIQRYADAAERDELHPNPTEGDLSYLEDTNSIEVYDGFEWVAGIPNQAITTAKIADQAVTTPKIAPGAVTTSRIADGAVTDAKIGVGAVVATRIGNGAVTANKILDGAVNASKIAGNAISAFERSGASVETSVGVPTTVGNLATVTLNIPSSWSSWECVAFAHAALVNFDDNICTAVLRISIDGTDGPSFTYQTPGTTAVGATAASFRSGITTTGNRTIALRGHRLTEPVSLSTVFLYARAFRTS